ncbi:Serine/threonine-protein kinase brsk1 [Trebouxia sp. C0010 RCD-2024]
MLQEPSDSHGSHLFRLVEGSNLSTHMPTEPQTTPAMETEMMQVASQLLDMSTGRNAVTAGPQSLVVDVSIKDVVPTGATAPYASPEVLHSLKLQFQGAQNDEEGIMINGCLADMWACGCILYQMLTGAKPFLPKETDASTRQAPAGVPASLQKQWRMYDAVAEAQREWLDSIKAVMDAPGTLKHPLLDRLGQCSSNPDVATEFFILLFWPVPDEHLLHTALMHPYLAECYANLQATAPKKDKSTSDKAEHVAEQAGSLEAPQQGRLAAPGAQSSVHEGAGQTLQAKQGEQPQVAQQAEQAQDTQHEHQSRAVQLPQTGGDALESGSENYINHSDSKSECNRESESEDSDGPESDCESEADSYATGDPAHMALSSHPAPAPISTTPNGRTQADIIRSGTAMPAAGGGVTAGGQASQGGSNQPSSSKCSPVKKLQKVLAKKLWPGCMRAADTEVTAPLHEQDKNMTGQKAVSEQIIESSSPAVDGKPPSKGKHGHMQKLKARAGRCLQKVMPTCMKPPPVHATPHKHANVQPLTAVAGSVREQWPTADKAGGQKKQLSKLTDLFKRNKAASNQAPPGGPTGTLATQPVHEPTDFIAALRQPYDLAQQADVPRAITTAAGKPATLVGANDAIPAPEPLALSNSYP